MLRLEKIKQLDRFPESQRKILIAEIKLAKNVLDLLKDHLQDKIKHHEDSLITDVGNPIELASSVKLIHELKTICKLFDQTEE